MMNYKTPAVRSPADCFVALCITAFLIYAVLVLGWSAGQMLVSVWLQTLVLFVLIIIAALVIAARTHWAVFLIALPVVGFIAFVTSQFINLFGMFAWGAWGQEQGIKIQMLTFNSFRNLAHFLVRVTEVLPLWEVVVIVGLETMLMLPPLLATRAATRPELDRRTLLGLNFILTLDLLLRSLSRKLFVNHFAVLIGAALATFLGGSRAIMLALLGLLFAIDFFGLVRALRASFATSQ